MKERLAGLATAVEVPAPVLDRFRAQGIAVETDDQARVEAGRDWWPLAIGWAADGQTGARPGAVVRPAGAAQVALVLAACAEARVPVTPFAGRSGVCGGVVPVHGGVALDATGLVGEVLVDDLSLLAEVPAGLYGPDLETRLRHGGHTLGHWPQSMDLSTVGGWIACRGAGQYSTRYGKIEDMVAGLEVALPDGSLVTTGHRGPRAAVGPDLTQLFCGSEGTLGVITRAWLRLHPLPAAEERRAYGLATVAEGLEVCRRILRRQATPAVLRLYDHTESERSFSVTDACLLIVLDEADPVMLAATMAVVDDECDRAGASRRPDDLVAHWLANRNDVSQLHPLWEAGVVVDTAEIAGPWRGLPDLAEEVVAALNRLEGTVAASVHLSHSYLDGACLYFTFAGHRQGADLAWRETYYRAAWDTVTALVLARGAAISHHHGIGLNRARFVRQALGPAYRVLQSVKQALDPSGIMNPGKLGLDSPFGEVRWP